MKVQVSFWSILGFKPNFFDQENAKYAIFSEKYQDVLKSFNIFIEKSKELGRKFRHPGTACYVRN